MTVADAIEGRLYPDWSPYEIRRLGRLGLALPGFVALGFLAVAGLMALADAETRQIARALTAGLELGLPLAAGLAASSIAADEPALDLQLTLRTRYRTTLLRRLALLTGWTAMVALAWASTLRLAGLWVVPGRFLVGQLSWLAPLLWFVAAGALLALLSRGRTAGTALLGGLWVLENTPAGIALFVSHGWLRPIFLFATTHTPGEDYWLGNRLALITTALALGLGALLVAGRDEYVASGGEA
jgi:hypothetical protein